MNPLELAFKIERCLDDCPDHEYHALHRAFLQQVAAALRQAQQQAEPVDVQAEPEHWVITAKVGDIVSFRAPDLQKGDKVYPHPPVAGEAEWVPEPVVYGVEWGKNGDDSCVTIAKRLPDGTFEVVASERNPAKQAAPVAVCFCGDPTILNVWHRKDGPCFAAQQPAPVKWLRDLLINTASTAVAAERQGRYPGAARVADWLLEDGPCFAPQQVEPVVEAHRVLVVESLPAALIAANWRETKDVGDEDIAAKLRRLHRLEKVVEAIESGESFEVLEKLAAEFRKEMK